VTTGPVYSKRVVGGSYGSGSHLVYTVPADKVFIIRCVDFANESGGTAEAIVILNSAWCLFDKQGVTPSSSYQWTGRQVLNAGDTITVAATQSNANFTISGYLLDA